MVNDVILIDGTRAHQNFGGAVTCGCCCASVLLIIVAMIIIGSLYDWADDCVIVITSVHHHFSLGHQPQFGGHMVSSTRLNCVRAPFWSMTWILCSQQKRTNQQKKKREAIGIRAHASQRRMGQSRNVFLRSLCVGFWGALNLMSRATDNNIYSPPPPLPPPPPKTAFCVGLIHTFRWLSDQGGECTVCPTA